MRGLEQGGRSYNLDLKLSFFSQETAWNSRGRHPSSDDAVAIIRFLTVDGSLVAERKVRLGDTIRNFEWPDDGRWQISLAGMDRIESLGDFDFEFEVVVPSADRRDWGRLHWNGHSHS